MASNQNLLDGMLRYVTVTSTALQRSGDELNGYKQAADKAAGLIPETVKMLVDTGQINAGQEKIAGDRLSSHEHTIHLLRGAVVKIAEQATELKELRKKNAGALGSGVDDPNPAGVDNGTRQTTTSVHAKSLSSPFVGQRAGQGQVKESDARMFRGLGLPVPTGT